MVILKKNNSTWDDYIQSDYEKYTKKPYLTSNLHHDTIFWGERCSSVHDRAMLRSTYHELEIL